MGGKGTRVTFEGSLDLKPGVLGSLGKLEGLLPGFSSSVVSAIIPRNLRSVVEAAAAFGPGAGRPAIDTNRQDVDMRYAARTVTLRGFFRRFAVCAGLTAILLTAHAWADGPEQPNDHALPIALSIDPIPRNAAEAQRSFGMSPRRS
jgi:hypothetical protein